MSNPEEQCQQCGQYFGANALKEWPPNPEILGESESNPGVYFTWLLCPSCYLSRVWELVLGWERTKALRDHLHRINYSRDWWEFLTDVENERVRAVLEGENT